jgi:hypothetical protein
MTVQHPLAMRVIDLVGADTIRSGAIYVGAENPDAMRREFCREYDKAVEHEIQTRRLPAQFRKLTGREPLALAATDGEGA